MAHVDTIRHIEADKDQFLKASRLERHESKREPLKPSDIIKIVALMCAALVACTILVIGYLSGSFVPALFGIGGFAVLVGFGLMIAFKA